MVNTLFICNQGRHRSRTAAELFLGRYAGIYSQDNPVTQDVLQWADIVYVMEDRQRTWIAEHFPKLYLQKKIPCLQIPDIYNYNDEKLIALLRKKLPDVYDAQSAYEVLSHKGAFFSTYWYGKKEEEKVAFCECLTCFPHTIRLAIINQSLMFDTGHLYELLLSDTLFLSSKVLQGGLVYAFWHSPKSQQEIHAIMSQQFDGEQTGWWFVLSPCQKESVMYLYMNKEPVKGCKVIKLKGEWVYE